MKIIRIIYLILPLTVFFVGCATTSKVQVQKKRTVESVERDYAVESRKIGPKKRIVISEFENRSAYGQGRLGKGISDVLATELSMTNSFIILEREKLNAIKKEQEFGQSDFVNEKSAPQIGRLLGANAIITGSITQFGSRTETYDVLLVSGKKQIANCAVDIRIVDVETGRIAWAGSGQGEATREYKNFLGSGAAGGYDETLEGDAFRAAIVEVMDELVNALDNMEWSSLIAKVDGSRFYINAGKKSNLEINQQLRVISIGEAITDPNSGAIIAQEETEIGKGIIVSLIGEDVAVVDFTGNQSPKIGDICKIY